MYIFHNHYDSLAQMSTVLIGTVSQVNNSNCVSGEQPPWGPGVTRIGPWQPLACRRRRLHGATCLPWVATRVSGEGDPGG